VIRELVGVALDAAATWAWDRLRSALRVKPKPEPVNELRGKDVIHIHNQSKAGAENHRNGKTR
jgi:hypothetical protein